MAQPSSSHHRSHGERSDRERSSHRHHRSISSTTLLLVLSLILAVLAVMLSLPSQHASSSATPAPLHPAHPVSNPEPSMNEGIWGYVTPKRSQALAQRERDVAQREAEVARREAEILVGAPGGVVQSPACPVCIPTTITEIAPAPTIIKEVVKEADLAIPSWMDNARARAEDIFDRELKIAEREREISRREESVNRREHDASRREAWIMEQLANIGDSPRAEVVEEEYAYEQPPPPLKRRPLKQPVQEQIIVTEIETEYATRTVTQTETQRHALYPSPILGGPPPANTRIAAIPTPVQLSPSVRINSPKTTSVEYVVEETPIPGPPQIIEEEIEEDLPSLRRRAPARPPQRWWG